MEKKTIYTKSEDLSLCQQIERCGFTAVRLRQLCSFGGLVNLCYICHFLFSLKCPHRGENQYSCRWVLYDYRKKMTTFIYEYWRNFHKILDTFKKSSIWYISALLKPLESSIRTPMRPVHPDYLLLHFLNVSTVFPETSSLFIGNHYPLDEFSAKTQKIPCVLHDVDANQRT